MSATRMLLLTISGDVHLKSTRTQRRLRRTLRHNITSALQRLAPGATITKGPQGRMAVEGPDLEAAAEAVRHVFGVYRVIQVERYEVTDFDDLVASVASRAAHSVAGRTFAARIRRRGSHAWKSGDAERAIGSALIAGSAGVDLDDPEVEVRAEVYDREVYQVERTWAGADGLPLGTQESVLSLMSGGFDSPVAAWMLMRRGCPVDQVHFMMDCSQSDHALAVAYGLWERWGHGHDTLAWVVDFTEIKESLLSRVESQQRQVVLKQLMFAAADRLAQRHQHPALVTGESVGQVSSQTITNLAEIDRACDRTVLRPLAGMTKNEIMEIARRCGSHDLSARAKEVCNLADGPVEVAAKRHRLARALAALPDDLVTMAMATRKVIRLADWMPGVELVEVHDRAPAGFTVVDTGADGWQEPADGALAFRGRGAEHAASRALASGRTACVVAHPILGAMPLAG